MKRIINVVILCTVASAQAEKNPQELLAEQAALAMAPDAGRLGEFFPGQGKRTQWQVLMEQGKCYVLSGAAGGGAKKMAVYLWGPDGQRITENRSPTLLASLQHCAAVTGMYKFEGKTASDGPWVVGLYQKGAPKQAIKDVPKPPPPAPVVAAAPPPPPAGPTCNDDGEQGTGNVVISCDGVAIDVYFDGQFIKHAPGQMPIRLDDVGAGCHRVKVDCWKGVFKHGVVYEGPIKVYGQHESRYSGRPGALDFVGKSRLAAPVQVASSGTGSSSGHQQQHQQQQQPSKAQQAAGVFGAIGNIAGSVKVSSQTTHTTTTTTTTSSAEGSQGSSRYKGSDGCDGDWSLGQNAVVNSGNQPGIECNNGSAPTNCPTGMYIQLRGHRKCYCVARCSDYNNNPAPGQACTNDGSFVCDHYGSLSTTNHATFCAPAAWNLCRK